MTRKVLRQDNGLFITQREEFQTNEMQSTQYGAKILSEIKKILTATTFYFPLSCENTLENKEDSLDTKEAKAVLQWGELSNLWNKRGSHVSNGGWHFFHWSATDCWCLYRMVGSEWLVWIESVSTTSFFCFFFLKHEGRWRGRKKQDYLEKNPDNQPCEQVSHTETGSEPRAFPWRWHECFNHYATGCPSFTGMVHTGT